MSAINEAYLDNSATTRVYPEVIEKMKQIMGEEYGNPSSLHRKGTAAERILSSAREELAELLGVKGKNLVCTSGGTESNNLAVLGIARRHRRRGNHLVTTAVEHSSVLEPCKRLEREGFRVTYVSPDARGLVDPDAVMEALTPETVLLSMMHVNNETGAIMPVSRLARVVKDKNPGVVFHVDAAQSMTKLPLAPEDLMIDAVSLSAHKFHGPKGVGALYLREGLLVEPLFGGGGQQGEIRPGTENTPGILGMALAARQSMEHYCRDKDRIRGYRNKMITRLQQACPQCQIIGPEGSHVAPHILNVSFPGLRGEVILHALEEYHIFVSTGSACHARSKEPSHVLRAMGLEQDVLEGAVRISFSWLNTEREIEFAAEKISAVVRELYTFFQ